MIALAPTSKPIRSSPREEPEPAPVDDTDDLDQEPDIPKPRLSLPMRDMAPGEDDEGSPEMKPPRLSLAFDEEELTQRSMEFAMRDRSERDMTLLSRNSLGSTRLSDRFGELSRLDAFSEDGEDYTVMQEDDGNEALEAGSDQELFDAGYVLFLLYTMNGISNIQKVVRQKISDGSTSTFRSRLLTSQAQSTMETPLEMKTKKISR
jgi:hypothetical protein